MTDLPQLVHSETAEKILKLKHNTLRTMRSRRTPGQPPYVVIGARAIRYDVAELQKYLERQTVRH